MQIQKLMHIFGMSVDRFGFYLFYGGKNNMKTDKEILEDAKKHVHDGGNQSWNSIALTAIEMAKQELLDYMYHESSKEENNRISVGDFLDKIDCKLHL